MARSKSSGRWLSEHFKDEYVKKAHKLGYRSRAVFKLQDIQERSSIIRQGMKVLDLGAAPGGWSQYAANQVGKRGKVVALDILPMEEIPGVTIIQGDFREDSVWQDLCRVLDNEKVDLVFSDMAPNISGTKAVDQPRAMLLAELTFDAVQSILLPGGSMIVKVFQGDGFDQFRREVSKVFEKTEIKKPKASRARSREVYILSRGFKNE
ncbi:MAG: 23S rRNA (uridine(2552)-2'-O)-methyltransferase RlmE [Methylococcales bacterium]